MVSILQSQIRKKLYLSDTDKTFQYDSDLPSLPVPPLHQTLQKYLESVRPLVSDVEYQNTTEIVHKFLSESGVILQEKLLARASKNKNWLEDWWLQHAYLSIREPLLPTMNTSGPQVTTLGIGPPCRGNALTYASLFLWSLMDFFLLLRDQRLKPQTSAKGQRLSMDQFRRAFNTTRIPAIGRDGLFTCFKTRDEGDCPSHVIVLCKGHIWKLDPFDSIGKCLTQPELESQLRFIRDKCDHMNAGPAVSSLTCDYRDTWAENRVWLASLSERNAVNLHLIEESVSVLVLDDRSPEGFQELTWEGLCGDTQNRWADKSYSTICMRNGCMTSNNDHTPYDGLVTVVLSHYQLLLLGEIGGKWNGTNEIRSLTQPRLITFDLDSKLKTAILTAQKRSSELINNIWVDFRMFTDFGKKFISSCKLHPDAFVQVAMQLAYMRLHGKPAPTYETATTRQFFNGRTETVRSCTIESVKFARTMLGSSSDIMTKKCELVSAVNRHVELMSQCQLSQGVDRHLMGLYLMSQEENLPVDDIFKDPSYLKSGGGGNFVMSSSTCGYTPIVGGVSAMVKNGYGIFYSILPDKLQFFLSTFRDSSETCGDAFQASLFDALREMGQVMTMSTSRL